ncbi:MAG: hypothetical protein Q4G22_11480 [Paracoccus sp. (in: a-proteobacteria)]|uniref:hypothetical protein n=1 Tax=Paracoccus sp. TaxID=267 RepID=UPI0026E0EBFA|nr:hypothetical protein [Paracoccus sp. (in: a-proteobacteria)]MDO5632443.1 hypothetical protein [Paracoccus sp. (in: a-proteobacteria)]
MTDLLLLGGIALCLLSVIFAIVQLAQTRPPRAAAILLVLGLAAILAVTFLDGPTRISTDGIAEAWHRVTGDAAPQPAQ